MADLPDDWMKRCKEQLRHEESLCIFRMDSPKPKPTFHNLNYTVQGIPKDVWDHYCAEWVRLGYPTELYVGEPGSDASDVRPSAE